MPDPTPGPVGPAITILNVDDNEANRYAVTRMLKRAGFAMLEADCGEEALRQVAARPDLVILDVNLPDIDGFEVCRRIKADPATASIPVLHLTASYVQSEDKTRGLDQGADGYLIRPVEAPELVATIRALLRVRAAEKHARRAALQWQATFDAIGDGVCLLDRHGVVLRSNRAAGSILGLGAEPAVGRPLRDLVALPAPGEDLAIGGRWFRVASDPILDDGAAVGSVWVMTEVTDRRRLADELRHRADALAEDDRRKDEFLAMLAHELRNPLAPILNAFEVMRGAADGIAEDLTPVREVAERQVRHLARLVDDLLDVSRITSAKIQLRREPVDLAGIVARVVETARPAIDARRHALTLAIEPGPLPILGDPTRLDQILTNLLNNSVKYTEPGGSIELAVARRGRWAEVRVADTGLGIPDEMLARIFDLFTQVERSLDRSQGGLGIGLTLVRRLVELHGGTVSARSEGHGRGSEFTVRLPLVAGTEQPSATAPTTARPGSIAPRRILVVDDQPDAAAMLARLLRGRGHDVLVAADGPAAIEAAAASRPDVLLLDIGLPGMDGYEVARRLRALPGMEAALLVALTSYGQEEDLRLAREAGFDHHLVKPTDLESIENLLAGGNQRP